MALTLQSCINNFKNTDVDAKSIQSIWNYCTSSVWIELSALRNKHLLAGDIEKSDLIKDLMNNLETLKEQK